MKEDIQKLYEKDYLTQKDIIQLLLHNTQHMVTRDELKEDNRELKREIKEDINRLDEKIDNVKKELKEDISNLRTELKEDISNLRTELKADINRLDEKIDNVKKELKEDINKLDVKIDKVDSKFDRLQWLIIATIITVLFKDKFIALIEKIF